MLMQFLFPYYYLLFLQIITIVNMSLGMDKNAWLMGWFFIGLLRKLTGLLHNGLLSLEVEPLNMTIKFGLLEYLYNKSFNRIKRPVNTQVSINKGGGKSLWCCEVYERDILKFFISPTLWVFGFVYMCYRRDLFLYTFYFVSYNYSLMWLFMKGDQKPLMPPSIFLEGEMPHVIHALERVFILT